MSADEAPLILRYRLMPADYNAYVGAVRGTLVEQAVRASWAVGLICAALVAGNMIWTVLADRYPQVSTTAGVAATSVACFAGLLALYALLLYPAYLKSAFSGQIIAGGETELVADAAGLTYSVNGIRLTVPWRIVRLVERSRHYLLFYGRVSAIILPRRAIASAADLANFVRLAERAGRETEGAAR